MNPHHGCAACTRDGWVENDSIRYDLRVRRARGRDVARVGVGPRRDGQPATSTLVLVSSLTHFMKSAATALMVSSMTVYASGAASGAPSSSGETRVGLKQYNRSCDFAPRLPVPITGFGEGNAVIRSTGSTVSAEVQLYARPDTHYDVVLIQAPQASSTPCGPGDPGTATGSINTDGAGFGTVTVSGGIRPGTTGAWVSVERPGEHSQTPAEYYSSDNIAPV